MNIKIKERDYNRLPLFYSQLAGLHAKVSNMRFGQLMYSFIRWYEMEGKRDVFYLEEDEFIKEYTKFINDLDKKYTGINI